ncbi:hypothetical protein N783_00095 [Pontibacillus marinus BH030004 = DSM 16465]|uniref:Uncharacterized protein n=1 Tax=Pontibacillus marinus BH030004 = DSM 16465 TaxID=1385511 RepID=A0A0A5GIJ7_9BACI|nr:hypothetical protein N783_00095 [Pontibacillus marinus BH030004 = DSM 16465]
MFVYNFTNAGTAPVLYPEENTPSHGNKIALYCKWTSFYNGVMTKKGGEV